MKRAVPKGETNGDDVGVARTMSDIAYRKLHSDIVAGLLHPDEPLLSDRLRETYQVGISPLREALTRLVGENLVTTSGQRGFRVAPLTAEIIADTLSARLLVESEALRRSIVLGDVAWEVGIVASAHSLTRTPPPGEDPRSAQTWSDEHRRFHFALIGACASPWLLRFASVLYDQAERHRMIAEQHRERLEAAGVAFTRDRVNEHAELAQLVLAREASAAVELLIRHYQRTQDYVLAAFEHAPAPYPETAVAASRKAVRR